MNVMLAQEIIDYIKSRNSFGKRLGSYSIIGQFGQQARPVLRAMVRRKILSSHRDYESNGPGQRESFMWYEIMNEKQMEEI